MLFRNWKITATQWKSARKQAKALQRQYKRAVPHFKKHKKKYLLTIIIFSSIGTLFLFMPIIMWAIVKIALAL